MTRANIYAEAESNFLGELGGDAYPGGSHWDFLKSLNGKTYKKFVAAVKKYVKESYGESYMPPESNGVSNWSYEYMFVPTAPPKKSKLDNPYRDWDNWTGIVLVREPDFEARKRLGLGEYFLQIPGQWKTMAQMEQERQAEEAEEADREISATVAAMPTIDKKTEALR